MKNIQLYIAEKYQDNEKYKPIEEGIYFTHIVSDNAFRGVAPEVAEKYKDHPFDQELHGMKAFTEDNKTYYWDDDCGLMEQQEGDYYVMSLSLEQEPELGENPNDQLISQYPLEDIEDKYMVFMADSYKELNATDNKRCYIELASEDLKDVQNLKEIIGKHVYNQETGDGYVKLIVE